MERRTIGEFRIRWARVTVGRPDRVNGLPLVCDGVLRPGSESHLRLLPGRANCRP